MMANCADGPALRQRNHQMEWRWTITSIEASRLLDGLSFSEVQLLCAFLSVTGWTKWLNVVYRVGSAFGKRQDMVNN
jgi:hypothetical protein